MALKHFVFAFPTIPENPVIQLEQVFGTVEHGPRERLAQNEFEAAEQLTALTAVAMLLTACTAPSTFPEENEEAILELNNEP